MQLQQIVDKRTISVFEYRISSKKYFTQLTTLGLNYSMIFDQIQREVSHLVRTNLKDFDFHLLVFQLMNNEKGKKTVENAILDKPIPCRQCSDVYLFSSDISEYLHLCACDALAKGHHICAKARRNHHIIHSIPVATSTRLFLLLFFFFSLPSFVTLSLSLLDQTHAPFPFHIYTYIHTSDAYKPAL